MLLRMQKGRNVNILIEVILNMNLNVGLFTQKRFVRNTLITKTAVKVIAMQDTLNTKQCKWLGSKYGCRRSNCEFSHVTHASNDGYECSGCKDIWTDMTCVKKHIIENQSVYFCLNCDDWIQFKSKVFDQGWTLLDKEGF